jgi:hypothetical protein
VGTGSKDCEAPRAELAAACFLGRIFFIGGARQIDSCPEATVRVYRFAGVASPVQMAYVAHKDHQGCRAPPAPLRRPWAGSFIWGGQVSDAYPYGLRKPVLIFGRSVTAMTRHSPVASAGRRLQAAVGALILP